MPRYRKLQCLSKWKKQNGRRKKKNYYKGMVVAAIDHGGVAIRPSNNMCTAGSKHFNETFWTRRVYFVYNLIYAN